MTCAIQITEELQSGRIAWDQYSILFVRSIGLAGVLVGLMRLVMLTFISRIRLLNFGVYASAFVKTWSFVFSSLELLSYIFVNSLA
jgi:hypothetical protein